MEITTAYTKNTVSSAQTIVIPLLHVYFCFHISVIVKICRLGHKVRARVEQKYANMYVLWIILQHESKQKHNSVSKSDFILLFYNQECFLLPHHLPLFLFILGLYCSFFLSFLFLISSIISSFYISSFSFPSFIYFPSFIVVFLSVLSPRLLAFLDSFSFFSFYQIYLDCEVPNWFYCRVIRNAGTLPEWAIVGRSPNTEEI